MKLPTGCHLTCYPVIRPLHEPSTFLEWLSPFLEKDPSSPSQVSCDWPPPRWWRPSTPFPSEMPLPPTADPLKGVSCFHRLIPYIFLSCTKQFQGIFSFKKFIKCLVDATHYFRALGIQKWAQHTKILPPWNLYFNKGHWTLNKINTRIIRCVGRQSILWEKVKQGKDVAYRARHGYDWE